MNTELISLGKRLGELYRQRAVVNLHEWQLAQDADKRKLYLYPQPDGYPGKNAEQREAARALVESADDVLQKIAEQQYNNKSAMVEIEAEIAQLEANRRSLEWVIRNALVNALAKNHIDANGNANVEYSAFDDVANDAMTNDAEESLTEMPF